MKNRPKYSYLVLGILVLALSPLFAQDTLKLMTYNLLNYRSTDTTRDGYFRTVVQAVNPDVLAVQEITSQEAVSNFLSNVLNNVFPGAYSAGTFIDGPDSDNSIFFRSSKLSFLSNTPIKTALRDISEFTLMHIATSETLRIYSVHLKASNTLTDREKRAAEVDSLRKVTNSLPLGSNFIVVGDFNIYASTEESYQKLLQDDPGNDGHIVDTISMSGTWNQSIYSIYHTQSTRVRAFRGGSTGGLDDRFDMILYSRALVDSVGIGYIPGSYVSFGNDGIHYNDSINKLPNTAVSSEVADALHYASDHLPVYAKFVFDSTVVSVSETGKPESFELYQNYPNPFNSTTRIRFSLQEKRFACLKVVDLLGREIATLAESEFEPGAYVVKWDANNMSSGVYLYRLQAGEFVETKKLLLLR